MCPAVRSGEAICASCGALRPGARVACRLFGERDSWACRADMTFRTLGGAAIRCLGLAVELFREIDEPGELAAGPKRWRLFKISARA